MVHNRNSLSPRLVKRTFKPYYILSDLQQLPMKNAAFSAHSSATQIPKRNSTHWSQTKTNSLSSFQFIIEALIWFVISVPIRKWVPFRKS